jgi:hypothetical protein
MTPRLKKALARDQLPSGVAKQIDARSPQAKDSLRKYLSKDVAGETDEWSQQEMQPGMLEAEDQNGLGEKVCALLESAGVDPTIIDRVRELAGDGTLTMRHEGDPPVFTTKKAFDRRRSARDEEFGAGPRNYDPSGMQTGAIDQPPHFPGVPRTDIPGPLQSSSDFNRKFAMDCAKRIKIDPYGTPPASSLARDRRERKIAQDARDRTKPEYGFLMRFPEAARFFKS